MSETTRRVVVNGEQFDVEFEGQTLHASWVSGRVADYGFSSTPHDEAMTDADLVHLIEQFLDQVGPDGVIA